MKRREIPAFLCVDVEPDGVDPPKDEMAGWTGYDAADDLLERLRSQLAAVAGTEPRFTWFLRMDPQVASLSPRADHVVSGFPERIERLTTRGDLFGLHVHPHRWSDDRMCWIHDYADRAWNLHCIESSVRAFTGAFGSPPTRHRYGGGYVSNDHIELLERLGVLVDLTPERRFIPEALRLHPRNSLGRSDGRRIGVLPDCTGTPHTAYRPLRTDVLCADDCHGRGLVMIPLTATRRPRAAQRWHRIASRLKHGMKRSPWRAMSLHAGWPNPSAYWDQVGREVSSMRRPYVAIAIRTNLPDRRAEVHARRILESLPTHPLARRLRFTDPLEAAPSLLSPGARAGLAWADDHRRLPPPRDHQ